MDELELPEPSSLINVEQKLESIILISRERLYWAPAAH